MKGRVVLVTGGRLYADGQRVRDALERFGPGSIVVHGEATGADVLADEVAKALGMFRVRVPYAGHLGRAGGPARNSLMVQIAHALAQERGQKAVCLAFGGDAGTNGCLRMAKAAGFAVLEFDR